jgi:hypothetical protein
MKPQQPPTGEMVLIPAGCAHRDTSLKDEDDDYAIFVSDAPLLNFWKGRFFVPSLEKLLVISVLVYWYIRSG